MMTFDEITQNAINGVSKQSKVKTDKIRELEINYTIARRVMADREFAAGVIGYTIATVLFTVCFVL